MNLVKSVEDLQVGPRRLIGGKELCRSEVEGIRVVLSVPSCGMSEPRYYVEGPI